VTSRSADSAGDQEIHLQRSTIGASPESRGGGGRPTDILLDAGGAQADDREHRRV
jgi:hypothetical protein